MDLCQAIVSLLKASADSKRLESLPSLQQAYYSVEFYLAEHYPGFDVALLRQDSLPTVEQARLAYELQRTKADQDVGLLRSLLQLNQVLSQQPPQVASALGVNLQDVRANQVTISDVYVTHVQGQQPPEPGPCPYKGMAHFDVSDAALFFGRGELTADLVDYLQTHRFLAIVGASGCGKSSLVRAGLIPTLQGRKALEGEASLPPGSRSWCYLVMTPTAQPLNALAETLVSQGGLNEDVAVVAQDLLINPSTLHLRTREIVVDNGPATPSSRKLMLVVDQFEELFTLNRATEPAARSDNFRKRRAFVDNLLAAAEATDGPTVVVITLRADFYGQCAQFENLRALLGDLRGSSQKFIGSMNERELRQAIAGPLEVGNWAIEPELVDQLLYDLGSEPGVLPLLSHALLETWNRRSGRLLTLAGYVATGRVRGAIARTAEAVYQGQLDELQRSIARNLFMRLTEPGTLAEDTRRRIDITELYAKPEEQAAVQAVLQILAAPKYRLVVLRAEQIEVAHEALIREWPRLREWIDSYRAAYQQLREVSRAARAWSEHSYAVDWLVHQGSRLAATADLTQYSVLPLSQIEQRYLAECRVRQRDLDAAQEDLQLADLSRVGWGVVFPALADVSALRDALGELLAHRRAQAGDFYREFTGPDGYRSRETAKQFLARHGVASGRGDPAKVPYYLLLVGDPETIPFSFQYQLDVQLAVGRIHFDTVEEYASYAHSVVTAEREQVLLPRRAVVFGVENPADRATQITTSHLVLPLSEILRREYSSRWALETIIGGEAKKERLSRLIGGDQTPALLFTASHGVGFPEGDARQVSHQGALLCSDWPGPEEWKGAIPPNFYFAADDVVDNSRLLGSIFFFWSCFSGGTPQIANYSGPFFDKPRRIALQGFLGKLPQRLLGHPGGGALAVIGRVERSWMHSFISREKVSDLDAFRGALGELLRERPVGLALGPFNRRYVELSATLITEMEKEWMGEQVDSSELASLQRATIDARNYIIIGDPAVRLRVSDNMPTSARAAVDVHAVAQS